jgi:HD-GYP domain-containing protein (c-di-GMP phosphodiesterase class II)
MGSSLPARLKQYIWLSLIPTTTVIALALAVDRSPSVPWPWLTYPLLLAVGWIGEEYQVPTRHRASHTLTAAIHLPFILLLTPLEAATLAALSCVCSQVRRHRSLYYIVYNAIVRVVGVGVPTLLLALWRLHDARFDGYRAFLSADALRGIVREPDMLQPVHLGAGPYAVFGGEVLAGCVVAALLYFVLDSMLVATAVAIRTDVSPMTAWQTNIRSTVLAEITKSVLGILAACIAVVNPLFVIFVALPVAMTHVTTKAILRLENETIDAVTALADAIDYRDPYTAQHSVRVAETARRLARRLGLSREQVAEIALAARVHDLGKIGISNDVLLKDGRLTPDEMAVMQTHPRIGVEVLQKYHNFRHALPVVLHHHERYDGKGYPDGLAGDAIPLSAQIVAHADAFDAMTSDRPYRKGLRPEVALQRVIEATGTQFNPAIAGVFVAMIRADLEATGQRLPAIGGSLAQTTGYERTASAEDNVRYLYRNSRQ